MGSMLLSPCIQRRKCYLGMFSDLPKVTQVVTGGAGTQTLAAPCRWLTISVLAWSQRMDVQDGEQPSQGAGVTCHYTEHPNLSQLTWDICCALLYGVFGRWLCWGIVWKVWGQSWALKKRQNVCQIKEEEHLYFKCGIFLEQIWRWTLWWKNEDPPKRH